MSLDYPTPEEFSNARKEAGLTQTELADKAGVSQGTVSRLERGKLNMTYETLVSMVVAVNDELEN